MSRTLNVGDKVRIAKDLHASDDYDIYVNSDMEKLANRIATITHINDSGTYTLRFEGNIADSSWAWRRDMFESTWLEVGMRVRINDGTHETYSYADENNGDLGVDYVDDMDEYIGCVGTITEIDKSDHSCIVDISGKDNTWWWDEHWIEPVVDESKDEPTLTVDDSASLVEDKPTVTIRFYNIVKGEKTEVHGATILDTLNFKKWVFKDASGNLYLINYTDIDYVLAE